jgi:hypothetical protein
LARRWVWRDFEQSRFFVAVHRIHLFVEMLSVVATVLWFKWTRRTTGDGRRLLRRARCTSF